MKTAILASAAPLAATAAAPSFAQSIPEKAGRRFERYAKDGEEHLKMAQDLEK